MNAFTRFGNTMTSAMIRLGRCAGSRTTDPAFLPPHSPLYGRKELPMIRPLAAEFIGTFWLVLGGCGSAVLAAAFPERRDRPRSASRSPSA